MTDIATNHSAVSLVDGSAKAIRMRLTQVRWLASDVHSLRFEPLVDVELPDPEPGSHIGLELPGDMVRQYSVMTCHEQGAYTIAVKREPDGRGGSRFIHDELRVGTEIVVQPPRNNFPLVEDAPHSAFLAGGIGITPLHAMIEQLERLGRPWELHYSCRDADQMAFRAEYEGRTNVRLYCTGAGGSRPDIPAIIAALPADAHAYCCGPNAMLEAFEAACAGMDPERVHAEYFGQKYEQALEGGFTVDLARSGGSFPIPAGKTILEVLREAGYRLTSSCEEGVCGACEVRVLDGIPDHRDAILSEGERAANASMMICCSGSLGNRLVIDL